MIKWKSNFEQLKLPNVPTIDQVKRQYNKSKIIKLNYNESSYGPSPKVLSHKFSIKRPEIYPEYGSERLVNRLAELYNLKFENFWIANGSDSILDAIPALFINRSTTENIIIPSLTFGRIEQTCLVRGVQVKKIPLNEGLIDLDETLRAIDSQTSVIYVVNPNMPTGKLNPTENIIKFMDKVPKDVLVVLDEAYAEYAYGLIKSFENATKLVNKYQNLLITRTFSKIYGLAAYRTGYAVAHHSLIDLFKRAVQIYPTNEVSIEYACVALSDIKWYEMTIKKINAEKQKYYEFLKKNKLKYYESAGNFIYIETLHQKWTNQELYDFLIRKHGILIRPIQNMAVRITIGNEKENKAVFKAIEEFLNAKKL